MGKVILIVLLVVAAVFWLRHKALAQRDRRSGGMAGGASGGEAGGAASTQGQSEKMVACVRCCVHLPQREAVRGASGALYCGVEHRVLAKDAPP